MKRNDFILSLKQGFNMEHTLEPISVSRWPLPPVEAEFLDSSGILRQREAMPDWFKRMLHVKTLL
jgi:hypothetical protein